LIAGSSGLDALARLVAEALARPGATLVFPSQLAADAWAVEALRRSGAASLDPGRLIGWDSFKEEVLSAHRSESPANRVTRTLWAASVVARQGRRPFLRALLGPREFSIAREIDIARESIIARDTKAPRGPAAGGPGSPEAGPSPAFVPFLAKIPPTLDALVRAIRARPGDGRLAGDPAMGDLLALHADYAAFLAERELFEPSWERGRAVPTEGSWVVVGAALLEDFEEYRALLEPSPNVTIATLPVPGLRPRLDGAPNLHEELRRVFLRVAALLDAGLDPASIGVTVAGLDGARPWVEAAAAAAGVPFVVRRGRPLASSPFGRLLRGLGALADADFSLPAMRALLLDRFVSFRESDTAARLVRFGVERHAFASYRREGRRVDIWEESFAVCGADRALASFYRRLRSAVLDLRGAPTFASLKSAIMTFRNQFLDESGWSLAEDRVVRRVMEELDDFARAEEAYAKGLRLPSPFGLFLSGLESETYMPQEGGGRVQVFPWRVSALLPFKVHFLLGCGQEALRVVHGVDGHLREDQREALGRSSREATEDFLGAYLLSGEVVLPSVAEEGIEGWTAPHPWFEGGEGEATLVEIPAAEDPLRAETAAWKAGRPDRAGPRRLLPAQIRAYQAYAGRARRPASGFPPLDGKALAVLLGRVSRSDGLLRLSSTLVDEYRSCPFAWLLARGLALGEEDWEPRFFDARLAGEMAHRALEELFAGMEALGPIEGRHLDAYRELAARAPLSVLPAFAARRGPFLEPMFIAWVPLLADRLRRLVENLALEPGWEVGDIELGLERALPSLGAVFEGRIDRLARRGAEVAIVDFKKRDLPKKGQLLVAAAPETRVDGDEAADGEGSGAAAADDGELGDTQIAGYVSLAEEAGMAVSRASYWSIEKAGELLVLGEGGLRERGQYGPELASLDRLLARAAGGIQAGSFPLAPPSSPSCLSCDAKAVCRSRYSAR